MIRKKYWHVQPQTVLRAESQGALWFHPQTAETLELDLEGLHTLLKLLTGYRFLSPQQWVFKNLLLARGFLRPSAKASLSQQTEVENCLKSAICAEQIHNSRRAPEVLHISITDACQQSCQGCFFSNRDRQKANQFMMFGVYQQIIQQAATHKVFQIALGGGEPLLHPQLIEMVTLGTQAGLVVNLTSSGSLLNAEKAIKLKQAGLGQLQLSLTGSNAETHQLLRPHFDKVLRAIQICKQTDLRFGLNLLLTRQNLDNLEDMLQFAQQYEAYSVNILRPKPSTLEPDWLQQAELSPSEYLSVQARLQHWQRRGHFLLQTDTSLTFLRTGKPHALAASGIAGCSAGRRMLSIQVDGKCSPCSHVAMYDDNQQGDFMQIWRDSEHLNRFRHLEDTLQGQCQNCELKSVCRGCRAVVLARSGNFYAEDPQCPKRLSTSS